MNWNYPFGVTEFIFIFIFLVAYVAFFARTIRVARRLKSTARALIIKFFIRSIVFALLLISLLGPSFGEAEKELTPQGKDIYLLVDLSKSMDATDVSPTRLEKVKFEINRLLNSTLAHRVGLFVFSNNAFVQSPLTYDQAALSLYVQSMQTDLLPGSGTNLCSGLELVYSKIAQDQKEVNKSKIILLFTDGDRKASCGASLFNNIRRFGFKVMIVGVGTATGSTIPFNTSVLMDEDGERVISKLDEPAMKRLARQTDGAYYVVNNEKNEMGKVMNDINSLEGQNIDRRRVAVVTNKYFYFLAIALGLLILDVLITVRTFRL
jgi:Ca-activated chloride channel homolog